MSLTSFLKQKDVKDKFRQEFKKPKFLIEKELLAPPLSKRYQLIGTAFDYLLRFNVKYHNPDAVTSSWIAKNAINSISSPILTDVIIDGETGEFTYTETELTRKVNAILKQARINYEQYLSSGEISNELIKSSILLGQLDPISRARFVDENIGVVYEEDINDLQNLISIVNTDDFKSQGICLLNPSFGKASSLVGGADADIILDDMIIDIKTTKNLKFPLDYFNQLIGYYTLYQMGGFSDLKERPDINKLAIYYSRHAYLYVVEVEEVIDKNKFPEFIKWFESRVKN